MDRVVPFFKSSTTIFYFKFFKLGKVLFGSVKIWEDLDWIWIHLNFEFESKQTTAACYCARLPLVSVHPLPCLWIEQQCHVDHLSPPLRPRCAGSGPPSLPTTRCRQSRTPFPTALAMVTVTMPGALSAMAAGTGRPGQLHPWGWADMASFFQPWATSEGGPLRRWATASSWKRAQHCSPLFNIYLSV
jgi:hypothetical protein